MTLLRLKTRQVRTKRIIFHLTHSLFLRPFSSKGRDLFVILSDISSFDIFSKFSLPIFLYRTDMQLFIASPQIFIWNWFVCLLQMSSDPPLFPRPSFFTSLYRYNIWLRHCIISTFQINYRSLLSLLRMHSNTMSK